MIGLEQYLEALAEQDASAPVEAPGAVAVEGPMDEPVPAAGPRRMVARKEGRVSVKVLVPDYRRIMTVFKDTGDGGLSTKRVAAKLGWDPAVATRVEGARGRMKRLVERGWLMQETAGWFMLPAPGPAAAAT
ncbi:hypothetical protein FE633_20325 [Streptomyces montanus]|uniref:Uncharacterized protein n=1 Tax=Streptomyces montanus TaxID=2580423 RepID=A0A5R9FRG9_9ACTN|nr:hypothetical protein FE633_20325 [Streptomyces montanus]